jgi:hypothetical protein
MGHSAGFGYALYKEVTNDQRRFFEGKKMCIPTIAEGQLGFLTSVNFKLVEYENTRNEI